MEGSNKEEDGFVKAKVNPDSTAVREPAYEEVEGAESEVSVRRLSRGRIMAIMAVVGVVVLGLMASQMFSNPEASKQKQATEEEGDSLGDAPAAKLDELEQEAAGEEEVPDKEAELRSKQAQEMKKAEAMQAALEKQAKEKEEEEKEKDDPWKRAQKEARRRRAQQYFQQSMAARGSGVFPRVESPSSTKADASSEEEDFDPAKEQMQFLSRVEKARLAAAERAPGRSAQGVASMAGQNQKKAFQEEGRKRVQETSFERLKAPVGKFVILAGTMLPLVLETGISSDLPGLVKARFSSPVYDTRTGNYLLIPAGTVVVGHYNSKVEYGQTRVQVAWSRMLLPNGKSMQLRGLPAVDLSGQSGVSDQVDNHWDKVIGGAALSSLFSAAASAAAGPTNEFEQNPGQAALGGFASSTTKTGQDIVKKQLDVQPTLRVRPGFRVAAFVREDLVMEPYTPDQVD